MTGCSWALLWRKFLFYLQAGAGIILLLLLLQMAFAGPVAGPPLGYVVQAVMLTPLAASGAAGFAVRDEWRRLRRARVLIRAP